MQIFDDTDVRYFLSFLSIIPPNIIRLFVVNNVMDIGTNRFLMKTHSGNGYSGARSNQICNLLPMTTNHVPSYKEPIRGVDYTSKGKVVAQVDLTVDVDESVNDEANLMMLVNDGNIIPH